MRIEDLFDLYAYNSWANDRVRTSIEILPEHAFKKDLGGSFGSIQGTITHLVSAQWAWLKRWQGNSPNQSLQQSQFSTPKEGISLWMEVDLDLMNFVKGLDNKMIQEIVTYETLEGKKLSNFLWQAMLHVLNHSTYHRGQITTLLRQVQAKPKSTDLIRYYWDKSE